MVNFPINVGIRKIADKITIPIAKGTDEEWFAENITVLLSNENTIATLVVDFAFSVPTIVEYTLDGTFTNPIAFNQGNAVTGGQSLFLDVTKNVQVNFRAKTGGTLIRCIVSSAP